MSENDKLIPSTANLWLRSCRLLDLDLLPDWPKVNERTFASGDDVRVKSKTRLRHAEWLLYRLYELWDPTETQLKLSQYFPALEPTQSIRLRSTLFTLLSALKQQGDLSNCTLRRSLLDECQGGRFEDLLLSLSTAVLREKVAEQMHIGPISVALRRLLSRDHVDEVRTRQLSALILGHSRSLSVGLRQRQLDRHRVQGLEAYILFKELSLQDENVTAAQSFQQYEDELSKLGIDATDVEKKIRHNSAGDEQWLSIALSGEPSRDRDAMLEDSFESMWKRTITGEDFQQHPATPSGLINGLESRVSAQRGRLQKWRDFQKQVSRRNAELIIPRTPSESPRKTPRKPSQSSPSKSGRRTGSILAQHRTPSPTKPSFAAPRNAGTPDFDTLQEMPERELDEGATSSHGLRRALSHRQPPKSPERNRVTPSPLKRSSSTRQPHRPALQQTQSESLHRAVARTNLRDAALVQERPKLDAPFDYEPRAGSGTSALSSRARQSMAAASRPRQSAIDQDLQSFAGRRLDEGDEHKPTSSNAEALDGVSFVSLAERTQLSLAQFQSLEGTDRRPHRKPHRRSQSYDVRQSLAYPINPHTGETPVSRAAPPIPSNLKQRAKLLDDEKLDDIRTPPQQVVEEHDADSVFKPRTRLQRSPPPG